MSATFRLALETAGLALGLVLVVLAFRVAHRLRTLDGAGLSVQMFLHAPKVRRFFFAFSLAAALFVAMPVSILAYLRTDRDALMAVHDASHVVFLVVVLVGFLGLERLLKRPPSGS